VHDVAQRRRREDRDVPVSTATLAAHSGAARECGTAAPGSFDYLDGISQPTLVVNGSNDIVGPTVNSDILQQNLSLLREGRPRDHQ
jgi:hypothetical protein